MQTKAWCRALWLARKGYVVVSIDYRLSYEAHFPAQIHDCKEAVRWVRAHAEELGINSDAIGVWGSSAGGHLCALLGTSAGVKELDGEARFPGVSPQVRAVVDVTFLPVVRAGHGLSGPEVDERVLNFLEKNPQREGCESERLNRKEAICVRFMLDLLGQEAIWASTAGTLRGVCSPGGTYWKRSVRPAGECSRSALSQRE